VISESSRSFFINLFKGNQENLGNFFAHFQELLQIPEKFGKRLGHYGIAESHYAYSTNNTLTVEYERIDDLTFDNMINYHKTTY